MQYPATRLNVIGQQVFTTSTNTPSIDTSLATSLVNIQVVTTAATGTTPSMTLTGQWSLDGGVTWSANDTTAETFAAITTTGSTVKSFAVKGPLFRLSAAVTGTTPSLTFKVHAHLV